jgi:hypothetical protein
VILGILRYMIYGPCHWILTIISYPIVPILVLLQVDAWLPNWCWWFQTWDNSLDGDGGWQNEHRPWLATEYDKLNSFQRWVCRFMWLWRNPVYGFERKVLGASKEGAVFQYSDTLWIHEYGYFMWNGKVPLLGKYLNWLIGWKIAYPETPAPICSTLRLVK